MKQTLMAVLGSMLLAAPAFAAKIPAKKVSMKGEIVDTVCYLTKGAHGPGHKKCAQKCIKNGKPAALLSKGELYLLITGHGDTAMHDQLVKHAGDTVTVSGKEFSKQGMKAILVAGVK